MKRSRILADVHETATAMRRSGAMDEKTMREFDALTFPALDESAWNVMAKELTRAMEDRNPIVRSSARSTRRSRSAIETRVAASKFDQRGGNHAECWSGFGFCSPPPAKSPPKAAMMVGAVRSRHSAALPCGVA